MTDLSEVEAAVASLDPHRAAVALAGIKAAIPAPAVEYPKMLHRRSASGKLDELTVGSPEEEGRAIAAGWALVAPPQSLEPPSGGSSSSLLPEGVLQDLAGLQAQSLGLSRKLDQIELSLLTGLRSLQERQPTDITSVEDKLDKILAWLALPWWKRWFSRAK